MTTCHRTVSLPSTVNLLSKQGQKFSTVRQQLMYHSKGFGLIQEWKWQAQYKV